MGRCLPSILFVYVLCSFYPELATSGKTYYSNRQHKKTICLGASSNIRRISDHCCERSLFERFNRAMIYEDNRFVLLLFFVCLYTSRLVYLELVTSDVVGEKSVNKQIGKTICM